MLFKFSVQNLGFLRKYTSEVVVDEQAEFPEYDADRQLDIYICSKQ